MFTNNYSGISAIFSEMYEGNINNLVAKDKKREIFQGVLDEDYQNNEFVELRIMNTYLEDQLYTKDVANTEAPALLHWNIQITQLCKVSGCNLHKIVVKNELRSVGEYELPPIPYNIANTIQSVLIEQVTSSYSLQKCDLCREILDTTVTTVTLPHVIKLCYPLIKSHNNLLYKLQYIDESLVLENTKYDIVGAIYGDDEHFFFRYILGDNIYEADGRNLESTQSSKIFGRKCLYYQ